MEDNMSAKNRLIISVGLAHMQLGMNMDDAEKLARKLRRQPITAARAEWAKVKDRASKQLEHDKWVDEGLSCVD